MALWILLAIGAQVINAIVAILDKYIVTSKTVLHPFSYAFYVSILSGLTVLVFFLGFFDLPFGIVAPSFLNLEVPSLKIVYLCFVTGLVMYIALVNLFEAFSKSDASDVVPVVSAVAAVGTLAIEALLLGGSYTDVNLAGFVLLVVGTLLVSNLRFSLEVVWHTVLSGFSFALYYGFIKYIFDEINFDSGFLYTRITIALAALLVITIPVYRKRIFRKLKDKEVKKSKATSYVLGIKILAGIASIMTLKAVQLGSVAVVQAMAGVQFLILIIFGTCLGRFTPRSFGENDLTISDFVHKIAAAIIISVGLFYTFL